MRCPTWVTAREIDLWAETTTAKSVLPELIRRLVLATVDRENLKYVSFPAGEEVHRRRYDGRTSTDVSTAHVPKGLCAWELSCNGRPRQKAEEDYAERLKDEVNQDTSELSYVAVTARDWNGAADWAAQKTAEGKFKLVRAYDSNNLEHWLLLAPAVSLWLAEQIGKRIEGVTDVGENVQATLREKLPPEVLLTNRPATVKALVEWVEGNPGLLAIRAPSPQEMLDVFAAWIHTLPPEQRDAVASRAIIVDDEETWKDLASSRERLILVAGSRLQPEPQIFAEARRQGHHVLRFAPFTDQKDRVIVEMERMRLHDLKEALQKADIGEQEAAKLAEGSGGSFTVFRRIFAAGGVGAKRPEWAQLSDAQQLAGLLLAAAWDEGNAEDCRIVAQLTGESYASCEALARRLRQYVDPPLRRLQRTWEFVSPLDAWILLHHALASSHASAFESAIIEVLGEINPVFEVASENRRAALLQGKHVKFSGALRRGLAEILALSAGLASENLVTDEHDFVERARRIVCCLLQAGVDWKRWASIGDLLPFLAEAAPDAFLHAVAQDLKLPNSALAELMRQEEGNGITWTVDHAGLLWALEALAWSPRYTARVADLFARLAAIDPGGRWNNRPSASLKNLFFSWRPQTMATVDDLATILGRLAADQPDVAWELLLDLLPEHQSSIMDSYKPSVSRSWAAGWTGEVLMSDYLRYVSSIVDHAVNLAGADGSRWPKLIDRCTELFPADRARIFATLERIVPETLSDQNRVSLWETLREIVEKHTAFRDADWALPAEEVERLAHIRDRFVPLNEFEVAAPLFSQNQMFYADLELPLEQRTAELSQRRQNAVARIWERNGLSGVLALAAKVSESWLVGIALAEAKGGEPESQIVPHLLCSLDKQIEGFAAGYTVTRIDAQGPDLAEEIPSADWTAQQITAFACRMPFNPRTWLWVKNVGPDVESDYWTKVGLSSIPKDPCNLEDAARKLIQAKRPAGAIRLLSMGMYQRVSVSSDFLFEVLEATSSAEKEDLLALDTHYVQQMIKRLQEDEEADQSRLANLEFYFLPILGKHTIRAQTFELLLGRDPQLFVNCLKLLYHPRHKEDEQPTEDDAHRAQRAKLLWGLLNEWQHVPGRQPDGSISATELRAWVTQARTTAREMDRLEVCDVEIGKVFAHAPGDEEGVRPCVPVRHIIELCESDEIERGFTIGLYNLRGPHWKGLHEGGREERELAATYESYAKACEMLWPRTASALRSLAQTYLREAEREDEVAQMRD